ncbi:hypothetical protein EKH55_1804 [Sinorhizobium alkalisoli]|nr:hypothetical protein EKH55_1804 [Sinorhizobium alkalisoli]
MTWIIPLTVVHTQNATRLWDVGGNVLHVRLAAGCRLSASGV